MLHKTEDYFYVIITGSIKYKDIFQFEKICNKILMPISKNKEIIIICGKDKGTDELAKHYANINNYKLFINPPNWKKYGLEAEKNRNEFISSIADALICFWDDNNNNVEHLVKCMKSKEKSIRIFSLISNSFLKNDIDINLSNHEKKENIKNNIIRDTIPNYIKKYKSDAVKIINAYENSVTNHIQRINLISSLENIVETDNHFLEAILIEIFNKQIYSFLELIETHFPKEIIMNCKFAINIYSNSTDTHFKNFINNLNKK